MELINMMHGLFKIGKKGTNDFGKVLDAHAECCAGVSCCRQVLIMKDQVTGVQYVGYWKSGVWTTKTFEAFKANGA